MTKAPLKYRWSHTWPEGGRDYAAHDGETLVGRIYQDKVTPKKGQWFWTMLAGNDRRGVTCHGYSPTKMDAAGLVERAYDDVMAIEENRKAR